MGSTTGASIVFRLMLVDSNRNGLAARKRILELEGYQVTGFRTNEAALEALALPGTESFHLVITSHEPKSHDGLSLVMHLEQRVTRMPVILISSIADSTGLTPRNTGADAVIQKSANEVAVLTRTVKQLLKPRAVRKKVASDGAPLKRARQA